MNPTLNEYAKACRQIAANSGFYCPNDITGELRAFDIDNTSLTDLTLAKLALVHSEVSEMVEAARKGDFSGFAEEMADVFIRLFDLAGAMRIDIEAEIGEKMEKNRNRPYKHGKLA